MRVFAKKVYHFSKLFQIFFEKHITVTLIGVAQTTYSDYENGRVRMPVNHIVKLARFYDVDLNFITGASNIRFCSIILSI